MKEYTQTEDKSSLILDAVQKFAISPEDVQAIVSKHQAKYKEKNPTATHTEMQDTVARSITKRYSTLCGTVGAVSSLPGIIPGFGTVAAAVGGTSSDIIICMKLEVDMCMCLAQNYDWDITIEDAQYLSLLIAGGATLEKLGVKPGAKIASKAGVKLLRKYLKGGALKVVKELFKKIGIKFTRTALEKTIPFGIGVVFSATANYYITKYVGHSARKWFINDRDDK